MYAIYPLNCRIDKTIIQSISTIGTPILSDVMGRYGCMDHQIRPLFKGAKLCGRAITVRTFPADNLMIHAALKYAEEGDVLVIDAGSYTNAGLWGEILTVNAMRKKLAGVVIDGGCRDADAIEQLGFPVFSRSVHARGGFKLDGGTVNDAVNCGGVIVNPGDLIVADACGVVVIPHLKQEEVYKLALEKEKEEAKLLERIKNGEDYYDIFRINEYLESLGVRFPGFEGGKGT